MTQKQLEKKAVEIMEKQIGIKVTNKEIHLLEAANDGSHILFGFGDNLGTHYTFEITYHEGYISAERYSLFDGKEELVAEFR